MKRIDENKQTCCTFELVSYVTENYKENQDEFQNIPLLNTFFYRNYNISPSKKYKSLKNNITEFLGKIKNTATRPIS